MTSFVNDPLVPVHWPKGQNVCPLGEPPHSLDIVQNFSFMVKNYKRIKTTAVNRQKCSDMAALHCRRCPPLFDKSFVLFLLSDIILNFRTTFLNKKGEVVSDPKSICFHYLRGWFILDLLAALPFDLIYASEVSPSLRVSTSTSSTYFITNIWTTNQWKKNKNTQDNTLRFFLFWWFQIKVSHGRTFLI